MGNQVGDPDQTDLQQSRIGLTNKQFECYFKFEVLDMTAEEVADEEDITQSTVYTHVQHARNQMQDATETIINYIDTLDELERANELNKIQKQLESTLTIED